MTKNDTCKRLLTAAAVLLAAAAMLHTLFVGLEIDEEYALSLGFRLVRGDRLFYSMWNRAMTPRCRSSSVRAFSSRQRARNAAAVPPFSPPAT